MLHRSKFNPLVFAVFITVFGLLTFTVSGLSAQAQPQCRDAAGAVIPCTPTPAPVGTDSDGDGIPDASDACPTEAGPAGGNGCADQDGDFITNDGDVCPDQAGPAENGGCPLTVDLDTLGNGSITPTATSSASDTLTALPPFPNDSFCRTATATTQAVNLRAKPSLSAEILTTIDPQDNYFLFQAVQNEGILWYYIEAVNNEWNGYAASTAMRINDNCANLEIVTLPQPVSPSDLTMDTFTWDAPIPVMPLFEFDADYRDGVNRTHNTNDDDSQPICAFDPAVGVMVCTIPSVVLGDADTVLRMGETNLLCDVNTGECNGISIFVPNEETCPTALLLPAVQAAREAARRVQTSSTTAPVMVLRDSVIPDPEPPYMPVDFSAAAQDDPCQIDMVFYKLTMGDLVISSLRAAPASDATGNTTVDTDLVIGSFNDDGTPADDAPVFTIARFVLPPEMPLDLIAAPETGDPTAGGCWGGSGNYGCQAGGNGNYIAGWIAPGGQVCVEASIAGHSVTVCNN